MLGTQLLSPEISDLSFWWFQALVDGSADPRDSRFLAELGPCQGLRCGPSLLARVISTSPQLSVLKRHGFDCPLEGPVGGHQNERP